MAAGELDAEPIATALSPERLAPFLRVTAGDLGGAVRLYEWNLAISGAMYEALGILEVVLRNGIDGDFFLPSARIIGAGCSHSVHLLSCEGCSRSPPWLCGRTAERFFRLSCRTYGWPAFCFRRQSPWRHGGRRSAARSRCRPQAIVRQGVKCVIDAAINIVVDRVLNGVE